MNPLEELEAWSILGRHDEADRIWNALPQEVRESNPARRADVIRLFSRKDFKECHKAAGTWSICGDVDDPTPLLVIADCSSRMKLADQGAWRLKYANNFVEWFPKDPKCIAMAAKLAFESGQTELGNSLIEIGLALEQDTYSAWDWCGDYAEARQKLYEHIRHKPSLEKI